jgi:signal transduction histidine kinase
VRLFAQISGLRVRLRLTVVYGGLFLASGAVLLTITYLLVAHGGSNTVMSSHGATPAGGQSVNIFLGDSLPSDVRLSDAERHVAEAFQQQSRRQQAAMMHQLLVKSGLALAIMAVVSSLLGWLVAGRVLRPLRTMTDTIRRISARNVHERLAVTGPPDELKRLADTVDGLLGRLEAALDSHKRFVANAAHELRTPLTVEHALLEETVLDPNATVAQFRGQFEELMAVSEQQARLLNSLLVLATSERGLDRLERIDLAEPAGDAVRAAAPKAHHQNVTVTADVAPAAVDGDPALVRRMVANLVDNAVSYNVPGGRVEVTTGTEGPHAVVAVTNTGPPVPPEMVDRLLDPFQRLDRTADDGHHGLGLSIVQAIAAAHAAELTVRARPGGGLAVRVRFAARQARPEPLE